MTRMVIPLAPLLVTLAMHAKAETDFWTVPDAVGAEEEFAADLYAAPPATTLVSVRVIQPSLKPSDDTAQPDHRGGRHVLKTALGVPESSPQAALLGFIGRHEAPGGYDTVYGKIRRVDRPPRRLTTMTVREVLAWQDSIDPRYNSEAAGRYQVMEDTLRDLVHDGLVDPNAVYDPKTQDEIAMALMMRAGWTEFADGRKSIASFGTAVARIWAALPALSGPNRGRSIYQGFNGNRSLVSAAEYWRVLEGVRNALDADRNSLPRTVMASVR